MKLIKKSIVSTLFLSAFLPIGHVHADINRTSASSRVADFMNFVSEQENTLIKLIAGWLEAVVNIVDISKDDLDQSGTSKNLSLGSGFLISNDGFIVTNNHVICDVDIDKIRIILHDGIEFVPKLIGRDLRSDIALLKISPINKLKYLSLGNSDNAMVGMRVLAIGNPFGFGHTVTSGIISYKSRNLGDSLSKIGGGDLVNYLQTDAAINNGNSGGPLIALSTGNVIGMNASMFSNSDYNSGINFAIPSNTIKFVVDQLKKFGKIKRPWLGIVFEEVPYEVLRALKISEYSNAVSVTNVEENSPAYHGGMRSGDIILEVNGNKLQGDTKIVQAIGMFVSDSKIKIKIKRNQTELGPIKEGDKKRSDLLELFLRVVYKTSEEDASIYDTINAIGKRDGQYIDDLGITVCELTKDLARLLDIQRSAGVVITDVSNVVLVDKLDIQSGDIILSIEQENVASKNIASINDLKNCLNNIKKTLPKNEVSSIAMFIERNKNTYYKSLKFPVITNKSR